MKKCGSCFEIKTESEFYKNSSKKDGLSSYCKKCNTLWVRKRYLKNKNYYDHKNKHARDRNRKFLYEFLLNNPCCDCGESDPIVLDFDHKIDKKVHVCEMVRRMHSLESIKKEIEKCEIRCSNCHRRKTAKQRSYYKDLMGNSQDGKAANC